jgi:hypothetical protein
MYIRRYTGREYTACEINHRWDDNIKVCQREMEVLIRLSSDSSELRTSVHALYFFRSRNSSDYRDELSNISCSKNTAVS